MLKKFFIVSLVLLAVGGVLLAGIWHWSERYFNESGGLQQQVAVIIPEGASLSRIAELLTEEGVIRYPRAFTMILRLREKITSLQAGEYIFDEGVTPKQVYEKLASGKTLVRQVTIPEGFATAQVLEIINSSYGLLGEIPADIKEGTLLPETYHYHYGDTKAELIERMQNAMSATIEELWQTKQENLPFSTLQEAITLASIVEKETAIDAERTRVASVFINRLRKNMRLQSDPTVIYAVTQGKYVLDRPISIKDLQVPSEYNTYLIFGLPPGPIANPGRASIAAVLNPMQTKDFYFVADGTGGHAFAKTLKEHNANVKKWRKIERALKAKEQE